MTSSITHSIVVSIATLLAVEPACGQLVFPIFVPDPAQPDDGSVACTRVPGESECSNNNRFGEALVEGVFFEVSVLGSINFDDDTRFLTRARAFNPSANLSVGFTELRAFFMVPRDTRAVLSWNWELEVPPVGAPANRTYFQLLEITPPGEPQDPDFVFVERAVLDHSPLSGTIEVTLLEDRVYRVLMEAWPDNMDLRDVPPGDALATVVSTISLFPLPCPAAELESPLDVPDFLDAARFQNELEDRIPTADWNGDGSFSSSDVTDFLADLNAGCP
ncbi:MAG: hypothetical protein AAGB34_02785 [Planctomycetota bacterium]